MWWTKTPLTAQNSLISMRLKGGGVNAQQNIPIYVYNLSQRMILMRSASLDLQFEYKHEYPGKVWGMGVGGAAFWFETRYLHYFHTG